MNLNEVENKLKLGPNGSFLYCINFLNENISWLDEQINQEKYTEYLSTVLREIHQDPLRKRGKEKEAESYKDSTGLMGKVIDLAQSVIKQNIKPIITKEI